MGCLAARSACRAGCPTKTNTVRTFAAERSRSHCGYYITAASAVSTCSETVRVGAGRGRRRLNGRLDVSTCSEMVRVGVGASSSPPRASSRPALIGVVVRVSTASAASTTAVDRAAARKSSRSGRRISPARRKTTGGRSGRATLLARKDALNPILGLLRQYPMAAGGLRAHADARWSSSRRRPGRAVAADRASGSPQRIRLPGGRH